MSFGDKYISPAKRITYIVLIAVGMLPTVPASAQSRDLAVALASVPTGGVLSLPGGDWGTLNMRKSGPSIIRSFDPSDPAVFSEIHIKDVEGLRLENLSLKYDWDSEDPIWKTPFEIFRSKNITLSGLRIEGDIAREGSDADRGYPWGGGLFVRWGQDITIENTEISNFYRGLIVAKSDRVRVINNDVHSLRMDGMTFSSVQDVKIVDNYIHDFDRSLDSGDHADMIQFWTNKTTRPNTRVVIRDNILNSGDGAYTQSIFMRNEEVDQNRAGREMFYRDILIEGNIIINAHLHGITLGESEDVVIRNNTLVQNAQSANGDLKREVWLPRISVAESSRNVVIENNIAERIPDSRPGWKVDNNLEVQPHERMKPGFYGQVFVGFPNGDPKDPASYAPRPGGPADRPGLGATLLRQ